LPLCSTFRPSPPPLCRLAALKSVLAAVGRCGGDCGVLMSVCGGVSGCLLAACVFLVVVVGSFG